MALTEKDFDTLTKIVKEVFVPVVREEVQRLLPQAVAEVAAHCSYCGERDTRSRCACCGAKLGTR
jgi:hypothetical protein